jgi:glycosyltransferase involved in cell wall biosynthesis
MSGPGLRSWHFVRVLLDAGHDVCLIAGRIYGSYPDDVPPLVTHRDGRWIYHSVADTLWHNPAGLKPLVQHFNADCAIGITTTASAVAADLVGDLPFWCDLYGSIMAEAQLKALVYGDDSHLSHFFAFERKAIERGDIFSSVSDRQGWALVGELGLWGRLNQWTAGYPFTSTIPIAGETTPYPRGRNGNNVIRGMLADPGDFVILYSGGYNTWTDVDTLFNALEQVMSTRDDVVFVSTGGKIEGHDDVTYTRFQRLTESSRYANRYNLQGWVANDDVPSYYLESDVGVNVDRPSYEAMLGSRTRILDWMRAGLPAISSDLTELSAQMVEGGAGLTYEPGDADELARLLLQCAADRAGTRAMGDCAHRLLVEKFTYEATTRKLIAWVENPRHAPDYGKDIPRLVAPAVGVGTGIAQAIERRSLGLGLAVQVWPFVARVTDMLGMRPLQKWLHKAGMHMLRLDRPPYKVDYLQCEIPPRMAVGELYRCKVRLRNDGTTPWLPTTETDKGFNLSYHWKTDDGMMYLKEGERTALPEAVRGGKAFALEMAIRAPLEPGRYLLELDMVREGVTWFSEAGSSGTTIPIQIHEA